MTESAAVDQDLLLCVRDLAVTFRTQNGVVRAVDKVAFDVGRGEILAIVGESGAGKSVSVTTLMGLTRGRNTTVTGTAMLNGEDLLAASRSRIRALRGADVAMIFQDPMTSLDPVYRVGTQIAEQIRTHDRSIRKSAALNRAVELMHRVGMPEPLEQSRAYPHELSGGMRQRIMIAMALSCSPKLLIADEPTTALDVTIQAQILHELSRFRSDTGGAIILVTHDLGVVAEHADRVVIMYGGQVVEQGTVDEIFYDPQHPYTWGLLGSIPRVATLRGEPLPAIPGAPPSLGQLSSGCRFAERCPHVHDACAAMPALAYRDDGPGGRADRCWLPPTSRHRLRPVEGESEVSRDARRERKSLALTGPAVSTRSPLLEVANLVVEFPARGASRIRRTRQVVHAVSGISFALAEGETLGVVGESGSGKSTLIRALVRLIEPTSGTISFGGRDITRVGRRDLRAFRREVQMVFQDPMSSLNPNRRVEASVAAALRLRGVTDADARRAVYEALVRVGLDPQHASRFPHEFSGGQRQRIGIARALVVRPRLILLDEPVSALDVSVQAQVINLLRALQDEYRLSYVLVAHDLAVVRHVSDRILVMYLGKVVERSSTDALFERPIHPYTIALLRAIPVPDPHEGRARPQVLTSGEAPSAVNPPRGCRFHTRCPLATEICSVAEPPLIEHTKDHLAACHHPQNVESDPHREATGK